PGAVGRRARKRMCIRELAAKIERAQKAKDFSDRRAGASQTLCQSGSAVFSQQPLGPHPVAICRREHKHAVHGCTARIKSSASRVFKTSPGESQPRRAMETPYCKLPNPPIACATVGTIALTPRVLAAGI